MALSRYIEIAQDPACLRKLNKEELQVLCAEIRGFLLEKISVRGGHLASNLGAVELTVAIHRVYDTERDRLVFDVGHQCYTHKLLTGRAAGFDNLRETGGMSGFPKPTESVHDAFVAGHASNSVSVALGMARARTRLGEDYDVLAVIGDGALGGGMALEALSDAAHSHEPLVIVLNDNGMSINRAVGGMANMLSRLRTRPEYLRFKRWYRRWLIPNVPVLYKTLNRFKAKVKQVVIPDNMFDDFGFEYIGPIDGHDVEKVENALRWAREQKCPCLVHIITRKGCGYAPAEQAPAAFHGVSAFDLNTGILHGTGEDFSSVFGHTLTAMARDDRRIAAITAAMKEGTGLIGFQEEFPDRFFDVGIAEEHACAMAGGMAAQGMIPVFAVYSTFLQRAYDMLFHDISLMGLHAVFCVDRAGIVGKDGQTHQGAFDVAYLSSIPGLKLYAPSSFAELSAMLHTAIEKETGPVALRYPRGGEGLYKENHAADGDCVLLRPGTDITLVSYGIELSHTLRAAQILSDQGISASVIKFNVLTTDELGPLLESVGKTGRFLAAEDVCRAGCLGGRLLAGIAEAGITLKRARCLNLGSGILENGAPEELRVKVGLDGESIARTAMEMLDEKSQT